MNTLWIIIGAAVVLGLLSNSTKNERKHSDQSSKAVRIDRLHYIDVDEYECSVCGAHFKKKSMACPKCATRFTGVKEDEDEFIKEMVLWDDD